MSTLVRSIRPHLAVAALACLTLAGSPALAQSVNFDFKTLNPASSSFVTCTTTDRCATAAGGALSFTAGGLTLAASGWTRSGTGAPVAAIAMQDYNGGSTWAGLGVYPAGAYTSSQDNIQNNDVLKLDFGSRVVTLKDLTLYNHGATFDTTGKWGFSLTAPTAGSTPQQFSFTANGAIDIPDATGSTFYFYGLSDASNRTFYLSSMNVTAVPEPGTLGLLGAGLAAVSFVSRRRRAAAA
jgi:hypothetical protein